MFNLVILFLFFTSTLFAENIVVGVSGLAKVGDECFLSVMLKDNSKHKFKGLEIKLYSTNTSGILIGVTNLNLYRINKNQSFNTSLPIRLKNEKYNCEKIKNVELYFESCNLENQKLDLSCNSLLKIKNYNENNHKLNVEIIKNKNFYDTNISKEHLISELGITLMPLNNKLLKKYAINKEKSGMVITSKTNSLFKEGDLIIELEMQTINNIDEFKKILKDVKEEKKESIFINFIRNNKKKLIAAYIK